MRAFIRRISRHVIAVISVSLVAACGDGVSSSQAPPQAPTGASAPQTIAGLEASGKLPILDRGTDVKGPDTNANGIRDDIDAFIAKQGYTAPQTAAVQQLAKGFQVAVGSGATTASQAEPIAKTVVNGIHCVHSRFADPQTASSVVKIYEKLTANTEARVRSYLAYNHALNGSVSSLPSGDTCEN